MSRDAKPSSERGQTDTSLREERDKTDRALAAKQLQVQERADQVLQRARDNADAVLTTARDRADHLTTASSSAAEAIQSSREVEDDALRAERAAADATLQAEREETARALARLLPREREKTDRYLLTERARSDRDIAQRDDFLAMVSHDLRNLLGGIVLSAGGIVEATRESDARDLVQAGAARIERYAARMNRLIGDLIDVASMDAGILAMTLSHGDARALVTEAVELFRASAAAKRITLAIELSDDDLTAKFDRERLLQVFANLLSNAIKFTGEDQTITIRGAREGDALRFSVTDTGVGVPPEMLDLIFERFWQVGKNDRRGTGLGLYISRCIVEAHGGRIWAESSDGAGTTVHFTFPLQR